MKRSILISSLVMLGMLTPLLAQAAKNNQRGYINVTWHCKYSGDTTATVDYPDGDSNFGAPLLGSTIQTTAVGSGKVVVDVSLCAIKDNQFQDGTTPFDPNFVNPCTDGLAALNEAILDNTKAGTTTDFRIDNSNCQ